MSNLRKMKNVLNADAKVIAEALKPTCVDGKWKSPLLSKRRAAMLRKKAMKNGGMNQWTPGVGGWLSEWDAPLKHGFMRVPKGHKNERNERARVEKIQKAMEKMPERIAEHEKAMEAAKPLRGLDKWLAELERDDKY